MPTVKVRNLKNKEVGEVKLVGCCFWRRVERALDSRRGDELSWPTARQGTRATKTRGNVSGSGRKLWKQKGTGRARIASLRSPLWKGGGNVHGPQPRDWSYKMPKKMRRGALRSALSERVREGNVIVIEGLELDKPKTKDFVSIAWSARASNGKTLIVDSLDNANLMLSRVEICRRRRSSTASGLNIYDILYHEKLVISQAAVEELEQLLDPKTGRRSCGRKKSEEHDEDCRLPKKKPKPEAAAPKARRKPKKEAAIMRTCLGHHEVAGRH